MPDDFHGRFEELVRTIAREEIIKAMVTVTHCLARELEKVQARRPEPEHDGYQEN